MSDYEYDKYLEKEMKNLFDFAISKVKDGDIQDDSIINFLSEGLFVLRILIMRRDNSEQWLKKPYLSDEKLVHMLEEARYSIDTALSIHIKNRKEAEGNV